MKLILDIKYKTLECERKDETYKKMATLFPECFPSTKSKKK